MSVASACAGFVSFPGAASLPGVAVPRGLLRRATVDAERGSPRHVRRIGHDDFQPAHVPLRDVAHRVDHVTGSNGRVPGVQRTWRADGDLARPVVDRGQRPVDVRDGARDTHALSNQRWERLDGDHQRVPRRRPAPTTGQASRREVRWLRPDFRCQVPCDHRCRSSGEHRAAA